jgi:signal transduction histidine kinase
MGILYLTLSLGIAIIASQRFACFLNKKTIKLLQQKENEVLQRIAGEYLHQQIVNECLMAQIIAVNGLRDTLQQLPDNEHKQSALNQLGNIGASIQKIDYLLRNFSNNIYPPLLNQYFIEVCNQHVKKLEKQCNRYQTKVLFNSTGTFCDLSGKAHILYNIYSLIDLFTCNSLKHAEARKVEINLIRNKKKIDLSIYDDGKGFDIGRAQQVAGIHSRGLSDFISRARQLSDNYQFNSIPEKGTFFQIQIDI